MDGPQSSRCGYTWPEDYDRSSDNSPNHQSCCYRETWRDYDYCIWHADIKQNINKRLNDLEECRETEENRLLNRNIHTVNSHINFAHDEMRSSEKSTPAEILDGANLTMSREDSFDTVLDLTGVSLRNADFSGSYLCNFDLRESDLQHSNLDNTVLRKGEFTNTSFSNASLVESDLNSAGLRDVEIRFADLSQANLNDADLTNADMRGTDLRDASICESELASANLNGADLQGTTIIRADLSESYLLSADLSNAHLHDVNLTAADLRQTTLTGTGIYNSTLNRANISHLRAEHPPTVDDETSFGGSDLRNTDLPPGKTLRQIDLNGTNLEGQNFRGWDLSGVNLEKANLTDTDLSEVNLSNANLERAMLSRADLFDVQLSGARLEGTMLGEVQVNENTFRNLIPDNSTSNGRGVISYCRRILFGPYGNDAYRCAYDPKSHYQMPPANESDDLPEIRASGVYRQLENLAGRNALPEYQSIFFLLRQDMQTKRLKEYGHWHEYWFALLQRVLFGYGEDFTRVVGWSGFIISFYSLVYLLGGLISPVDSNGNLGQSISLAHVSEDPTIIWDSFYTHRQRY